MVMAIVCTMTANAQKHVYFATHRFVQDEYGEMTIKRFDDARCPTRIELDMAQKTLLVKTKKHGTASYTFSDFKPNRGKVFFYQTKGEKIGCMQFDDRDNTRFNKLIIYRSDGTIETYEKNCYCLNYEQYCEWRECVKVDFEKSLIGRRESRFFPYDRHKK